MGSVFICHSWNDKPFARKLADTLKAYGVKVWLDEAEINIGDSLIEKIRAGIDEVDYVIAIISRHSIASEWVKKELDIAMNQEIEGKKIKVLPILTEQCRLPGFLEGKLYANMINKKFFKQSMPMLLSRLKIDPNLFKHGETRKPLKSMQKELKRARELTDRLTCDDPSSQYIALRDIKWYKDSKLYVFNFLIEAIINLTLPANPDHIRLQAIKAIGYAKDSNYSSYLEPFLDDNNPSIVSEAINSLASLQSGSYANYILEILQRSSNHLIKDACLNYLSKVNIREEGTILRIIDALQSFIVDKDDISIQIQFISILGRQWNGFHDCALEALIPYITSKNNYIRKNVLSVINEYVEECYISSPSLRKKFEERLNSSLSDGSDIERATVWIICLLFENFNKFLVWQAILDSDEASIEAFLDMLNDYNIDSLLIDNIDLDSLNELLLKYNGLSQKICNIIAQINNPNALNILNSTDFNIEGWRAVDVLQGIARIEFWDERLRKLLQLAMSANDNFISDYKKAFSLFAKLKSGDINLENLLREFPNPASIKSRHIGSYNESLLKLFNDAKKGATVKQQQKISRIIKVLNPYEIEYD